MTAPSTTLPRDCPRSRTRSKSRSSVAVGTRSVVSSESGPRRSASPAGSCEGRRGGSVLSGGGKGWQPGRGCAPGAATSAARAPARWIRPEQHAAPASEPGERLTGIVVRAPPGAEALLEPVAEPGGDLVGDGVGCALHRVDVTERREHRGTVVPAGGERVVDARQAVLHLRAVALHHDRIERGGTQIGRRLGPRRQRGWAPGGDRGVTVPR